MEKDILTEMIEKQYRLLDKHSRLLATPILTGIYSVTCECCTDENGRIAPYKISFECDAGLSHNWTNMQIMKSHNWGLFRVYKGMTMDEVFHYRFRLKYYKLTRKWELKILLNSTSKKAYIE